MRTPVPEAPAQEAALPIDPRIHRRRVEVERERGRRRRRVLIALASATALVAGGFALLHSSLLGVHRVTVAGPDPVGTPALLRAAGIRRGEPLVDVAPAGAARRLEDLPWVGTATVRRRWPGSLRIVLTDRLPVAELPAGAGSGGSSGRGGARGPVALVDATGRVIADRPAPVPGLPLLVGVGTAVPPGQWLAGSPDAPVSSGPSGGTASSRPLPARTQAGARAAAALTLAAALDADHLAATKVDVRSGGDVSATISGGATVVDFGPAVQLTAKLAALRALAGAGGLQGAATVHLGVPSRPTVTPVPATGGGTTGTAATSAGGASGGSPPATTGQG